MELRLKREAAGKKYGGGGASERLVKREICNVLSKGTFIDSQTRGEENSYEPRYVLALKRSGNSLGVTFFDVSTLKFFVG
jgi:DNA mismatch repair ATPase MutS